MVSILKPNQLSTVNQTTKMQKIIIASLCALAVASGHGSSHTSVSKPHQGDYKYGIDHHYHGHWSGSAHPHGYGGLGEGHGSYGVGGGRYLGAIPQGGYAGLGYAGHGHGHHGATSYANYNQHSINSHFGHHW